MPAEQRPGPDVLIAADQAAVRETLADLLELKGCRVATPAHGQEALVPLRSQPLPHVISLDLCMPVMDGPTFRKAQQGDPRWPSFPS